MSTTDSTDYEALINQYATEASDETTQAVEAIEAAVHEATEAGDEAADVGREVWDILGELSAGDRMAAAQAAMDLFDDQTGTEVEQAVDALRETLDAGRVVIEQVMDIADVFADAEAELQDDIASIDLPLEYFQF